jgi:hypothetical protein
MITVRVGFALSILAILKMPNLAFSEYGDGNLRSAFDGIDPLNSPTLAFL